MRLSTLKPKLAQASARLKPLTTTPGATPRSAGRAWQATRSRIAQRDGFKCANCGRAWFPWRDHVDHIIELADGGADDDSNLQLLCNEPCHREKTEAARQARG